MSPLVKLLTSLLAVLILAVFISCSDGAQYGTKLPETPEVVDVTFSGTAGEPDSRFIIRFDEPVFVTSRSNSRTNRPMEVIKEVEVEKVVDVNPNAYNSDSSVMLDVGYSGYGSEHHIPLQTKTSLDQPSRELSFGPVEREFAIAYRILVGEDTAIIDSDGTPAVIDFPNVVFVNPEYKDGISDSKLVNCVASMEILGYSPIILDNVKNLRSDKMTDSERIEWRLLLDEEFHYGIDGMMRLPCRQLWSEAINSDNESKRNRDAHCMFYLSRGTEVRSDAIELVNRPYTSLDASDRIQLRLVLNSDPDLSSECAIYYPQLFYGRWVPMTSNR